MSLIYSGNVSSTGSCYVVGLSCIVLPDLMSVLDAIRIKRGDLFGYFSRWSLFFKLILANTNKYHTWYVSNNFDHAMNIVRQSSKLVISFDIFGYV
jgi:hypothetical protein